MLGGGARESGGTPVGVGSLGLSVCSSSLACETDAQQRKGQPWLFIGPGHVVVNCAMVLLWHLDTGR